MSELKHGDRLFPNGEAPVGHQLSEKDGTLTLELEMYGGDTFRFQIEGVISYRFTLMELFKGLLESGADSVVVLEQPAWGLRLADEESSRGDFVRRRRFFHLNVSDVGVLECYALAVRRL